MIDIESLERAVRGAAIRPDDPLAPPAGEAAIAAQLQ
jgi:hypothetical protein